MISLLVSLLILLVVIYIVHLIIDALGLPANIKKIVVIIVGLIFLLSLLSQLGIISNIPLLRWFIVEFKTLKGICNESLVK